MLGLEEEENKEDRKGRRTGQGKDRMKARQTANTFCVSGGPGAASMARRRASAWTGCVSQHMSADLSTECACDENGGAICTGTATVGWCANDAAVAAAVMSEREVKLAGEAGEWIDCGNSCSYSSAV